MENLNLKFQKTLLLYKIACAKLLNRGFCKLVCYICPSWIFPNCKLKFYLYWQLVYINTYNCKRGERGTKGKLHKKCCVLAQCLYIQDFLKEDNSFPRLNFRDFYCTNLSQTFQHIISVHWGVILFIFYPQWDGTFKCKLHLYPKLYNHVILFVDSKTFFKFD